MFPKSVFATPKYGIFLVFIPFLTWNFIQKRGNTCKYIKKICIYIKNKVLISISQPSNGLFLFYLYFFLFFVDCLNAMRINDFNGRKYKKNWMPIFMNAYSLCSSKNTQIWLQYSHKTIYKLHILMEKIHFYWTPGCVIFYR